jgi:hypothetical protein
MFVNESFTFVWVYDSMFSVVMLIENVRVILMFSTVEESLILE